MDNSQELQEKDINIRELIKPWWIFVYKTEYAYI